MARTIITDAKHLPGLLRQRFRGDTKALRAAATDATAFGVREAVRITDALDLVDQSHYKQSWKQRPLPNGSELRNDAPHAPVLEHGRRPNRPGPPIEPILEWVKRKLDVPADEAEHVAWLIQRRIHQDGSPPYHVLEMTFQKMLPAFQRAARRRLLESRERGGT